MYAAIVSPYVKKIIRRLAYRHYVDGLGQLWEQLKKRRYDLRVKLRSRQLMKLCQCLNV
jgi:ADP-heptose:LPS heptosyltransferase